MTLPFHAGGLEALTKARQSEEGKAERRQRIEQLLAGRAEEFASAGYSKKQAILEAIHQQVDREESLEHCLF